MVHTSTNPNWWREYALATLARILYYGFDDWYTEWAAWAGFTTWQKFPARTPTISNYVMFKDASNALLCFEGTRGTEQWFGNFAGAIPRNDPMTSLRYHSYFLMRAEQVWPDVVDFLFDFHGSDNVMCFGHSLGGAIANVIADRLDFLREVGAVSLETMGQPRTASGYDREVPTYPYIRLIKQDDVVPGVPPPYLWDYRTAWIPNVLSIPSRFLHTVDAWIISGEGTYVVGDNFVSQEILGVLDRLTDNPVTVGAMFRRVHNPGRYVSDLARFQNARVDSADMAPLVQLNREIESWDEGAPIRRPANPPPVPPPFAPSVNPFIDPDALYSDDGEFPEVPLDHIGRKVEQRFFAHTLYFFGGRDIMAKTMQGHDRQLLITAKKVLQNIQHRDARVANPKKTRRLSNRILMFPPGGTPDVKNELAHVINQLTTLLGLTT